MIRGQLTVRAIALLVGLALVSGGCAARRDYRRGQAEAKNGNWDAAVARLTRAQQRKPGDIGIMVALENARIQASRQHADLAQKHIAANDLAKAADELEIATKYDPSNKSASDDLAIVRRRIRKGEEEAERLATYDATKAAAAARPVVPVLSPRSPKPILLKWGPDQPLQKLIETLGKLAGVNMLFDEGFRDKNVSVSLNGVTFQEALDQITFINRMFYKVVDQNTLIIVPDSAAKRRTYDEWILRTFYIQNAEIKDVETVLKQALGSGPKVSSNPTLGAITIMGTPDHLALAARIIELNDKARGEVVIEVQVMEIDRERARDYGIALSNYGLSATFAPTAAPPDTPSATTNVRAHMLSSLNLADFVVSVPASIFSQFTQSASTGRIVAAPKLRAAEGKKTTLKIGRQVPVPTTTFQTNVSGGSGTFTPATSFTYRDVGVTLDITPKVNASGDITLETAAEFSLLGPPVLVPQAGAVLSFLTRQVTGLVRVRDGETILIGGLLQDEESESLAGLLGIQKVPILNSIFSTRSKKKTTTEVVISMTTHLVRAPKVTAEDLVGWNVGTQELVKVRGARPPLFGATPEEVAAPASPAPAAPIAPAAAPPSPAPGMPGSLPSSGPTDDTIGAAPVAPLPMSAAGSGAAGSSESGTPAQPGPPATPVRASLTPPLATVHSGDTTSLGVVVMGGQDMTAAEVILSFDPMMLSGLDAVPGPLFTLDGVPVGTEKNLEPGRVRARFTRSSPAAGSGVIATFTFQTLRTGVASVKVEAFALSTSAGTVTPTVAAPAQVNVE